MIVSRSVYMVRHPRGSYTVHPLLSLDVATSENKYQVNVIPRCHPHARKSALKEILSGMRLALHATRPSPHGASRLVQAMSAWSVKTRRVSPRHCRYARFYGHTTAAMHDMSTPSPLSLSIHTHNIYRLGWHRLAMTP